MMKHTPPPNYALIRKHFPNADFKNGIVFTYFPDIYIKGHIQPHLLVHEQTHLAQQSSLFEKPDSWWEKYISDKDFRIQMEIEAYHNQYKHSPSLLHQLASDLSSPLYGSTISYKDASASIKYGSRIINGQ